ncbi:phenylalanine ammonia-lyase [Aspergillus uvarum CBS 121591]|uniref:Phenylalanine ammonia-lyase n=1 Tax=Aspergillus uvarum CBS 121591 TaxID=1448315 RepID=A0A319CL46_9EURO|nr:phenylalanine ammonia-lyase [Aspergillus uvarum CBS 121591]PYH85270.1 phenylalanine ammonia-lyase [Aspergillus uvarum CBS 121591]
MGESVCRDEPKHYTTSGSFTESVLSACQKVQDLVKTAAPIVLDGRSLDISSVIAVARHNQHAVITESKHVVQAMQASVDILAKRIQGGEVVYGVNTGFGGSADTRTREYAALQKALIQMQTSCILLPQDRVLQPTRMDLARSHSMPVALVRAAMLTRCNSLIRGHSAVRPRVVENALTLLQNGMTPVVPLRGSISASGDLAPLSYIAGLLEGNSDISVHVQHGASERIIRADQALQELGLEPLDLGPKEGLGLLNGTAFSSGAASLVLFEANQLILLSQLLTAMATEAMAGRAHNYHPFIAAARPHPGQLETAVNIFTFLSDSSLAVRSETEETGGDVKLGEPDEAGHVGLSQDRYALRTATQWMGPQLETMALASQQVGVELNSTTDNPLVNPLDGEVYHGGNFQAASITSAMEKTASALQMTGKMVFAQCSEILNPALSHGLPPNLSIGDPSLDYAFKGLDINMAAYVSELGYLNHPVSNHVQSAEMHNQGLNSLALIAARYATESVEVLSLMMATYLYILCQAVDLRVLQAEFTAHARVEVNALTAGLFPTGYPALKLVQSAIWDDLMFHWSHGSTMDLRDRAVSAANSSVGTVLRLLPVGESSSSSSGHSKSTVDVRQWTTSVADTLERTYDRLRTRQVSLSRSGDPAATATTAGYLCKTSRRLYLFVREELGVPLHRGYDEHPTANRDDGSEGKLTIGSQVSKVYTALREGRLRQVLLDSW